MVVKCFIEVVLEQVEQIGFVCFLLWFCLFFVIVELIIGILNFIFNLFIIGGEKFWE